MSALPHRLMEKRQVKGRSLFTREFKEQFTAWVFSAPALLLLLVFMVIPFFMAFGLSLTDQRLVSPLPTQFIGLDNFVSFLSDKKFHQALLHNFLFALVVIPVQGSFALLLAMLTNQKIKGTVFFRTIYFIPVATMIVVIAVVWVFFYQPEGIVNAFLNIISFGLFGSPKWLSEQAYALPAIIIMSIWQGVGWQMLLFLAGLQGIPEDLYEAARLDGAGPWSRFIHVTIPQLRSTIVTVYTLTAAAAFQLFSQVSVMTQGGPENATMTAVYYIYEQGVRTMHVGYASVLSVIFFLIALVVSNLNRFFPHSER